MKSWRLLATLLLALALVAAACGGDDGGDDESSGTTAGDTTTTAGDDGEDGDAGGEGAEADVDAYCDAVLQIETLAEPDVDFEAMSQEEAAVAAREFASENLQPLAQQAQEVVPEEIADDIQVLVDAVDEISETGDFSVFETPEVQEASDRAHAFDLENCGWSQVDVTAVDYAFEGLDDVEAGPASFEFTNSSESEMHELVLLRKNEGTTESAEELLQLPEEEAMSKVTFTGVTFADPGEDDYFVADLEAGDYMAVCFIPVGASEENEEGTGPPHFTQGMIHEFTVG